MSLLRLSRPGYPTQLIVQEPATATVMGHGGSAMGFWSGTTLKPEPKKDRERREQREAKARVERQAKPLCQKILPYVQEPCARMLGHKDSCRSAEAMANARIDRRTFRRPEWNKDDAA